MRKPLTTLLLIWLALFTVPSWAEEEEKDEPAPPKVLYYKVAEPFTINFLQQSKQEVRYLQIKLTLMASEQTVLDNANTNLPMIQDSLRMLFSEQSMESVGSVEGRRALQQSTLKTVNSVLKKETGTAGVEAAYFTSFILQ
jgi:flagellar protein FliL